MRAAPVPAPRRRSPAQLELYDTVDCPPLRRFAWQAHPAIAPALAGSITRRSAAEAASATERTAGNQPGRHRGPADLGRSALAELNARAGGGGGLLSVPQIAALARLARRLGITISRAAVAADGDRDIDLWVRADPSGDEVALSITGWGPRPAQSASAAAPAEREADFLRASADWTWETDDALRLTALSGAAAAGIARPPAELIGKQLTRLFRFRESEGGSLPILTALAEHQRFDGQIAELRVGRKARYLLSGVPLIDGMGRFAGFRGAAVSLRAEDFVAPARTGPERASAFGERLDQALRGPLAHIGENAERRRAQPEGPLRRE